MSKKSKKLANENRAARAQALIEERRQAEQRRRMLAIGGVVLAVVLIGALAWFLASRDSTGDDPAANADQSEPTAAQIQDYGIVLGEADAPKTVTVYEDLQCPACQSLEMSVGQKLTDGLKSGAIQVDYRLISFLDGASTNEYSSRATNAVLVVLEESGPEVFKDFHDELYAQQPAEGGDGFTDDELIDLAVEAGADEAAITTGIKSKIYDQWIKNATDQSSKDGVTGTPTVEIDGERVEDDPVAAINAAVDGQ